MPVVKFSDPDVSDNRGSCARLVKYLEKENDDPGRTALEKEFFYDNRRDFVLSSEVIQRIDNNKKKLRKDQAKFFMLTINYSDDELTHMASYCAKRQLSFENQKKEFTRCVMEQYRINFNIPDLLQEEILWFAKDEHDRYEKGVGAYNQIHAKEGLNDHTHVIISRLRDGQTRAISPMTNHKSKSDGPVNQGFCRSDFKTRVETEFDGFFSYDRPYFQKYVYLNTMVNGSEQEKETQLQKLSEWGKHGSTLRRT